MKETDLDAIKRQAVIFLYLEYQLADGIPSAIHVYHPFISSTAPFDKNYNRFLDLTKNEDLDEYRANMEEFIANADLYKLYTTINKPYRLTFIKYIEDFLSDKDLGELLADAWVSTENPNDDVNCSIPYLTKLFQRCDKRYLMTEEDYRIYEQLPEQFTIYRGVMPGHNPKGLSWTQNKDKAIWFASRFNTETKKGYLLTTIINKSDVLAYFNTRGEEEILVNANKYKRERIEL